MFQISFVFILLVNDVVILNNFMTCLKIHIQNNARYRQDSRLTFYRCFPDGQLFFEILFYFLPFARKLNYYYLMNRVY